MPASPTPAATVVLLREGPHGPEVFLVKRTSKASFMPSVFVFPGGKVDAADADLPVHGALEVEPAFTVAAVREVLEEAGVLLAEGELWEGDREGDFHELARSRPWRIQAERLRFWAWWITPEAEPRRFDTRFFVARVEKEGDQALHDAREVVASGWWPIRDALRAFDAGEVVLAPPTWKTLEELVHFPSVRDALEAAPLRARPPTMPLAGREGDTVWVELPTGERFQQREGRWSRSEG